MADKMMNVEEKNDVTDDERITMAEEEIITADAESFIAADEERYDLSEEDSNDLYEEESELTEEERIQLSEEKKFSEELQGLLTFAKGKKNVLEFNEINVYFQNVELNADRSEKIFEFLEANNSTF